MHAQNVCHLTDGFGVDLQSEVFPKKKKRHFWFAPRNDSFRVSQSRPVRVPFVLRELLHLLSRWFPGRSE